VEAADALIAEAWLHHVDAGRGFLSSLSMSTRLSASTHGLEASSNTSPA
jgi:hypothetical protein